MKISDETLSAFLDGELSEREMAAVRAAILRDPALAGRLGALAQADDLARRQAHALDDQPMPEAVLELLRDEPGGQVIRMSLWQRSRRFAARHAALAAGLALVIGFVAGHYADTAAPGSLPGMAALAGVLDGTLSGEAVEVAAGTSLTSRFSFRDVQDRVCRQYLLQSGERASENVACREDGDWTLVASVQLPRAATGEYRTASGPALLDSLLDTLMQGDALGLDEEARLIRERWAVDGEIGKP